MLQPTQCSTVDSPQLTRLDRLALFLDPYAQHVLTDPVADNTSNDTIVLLELITYHPKQQTLEQERGDWVKQTYREFPSARVVS